MILAAALLGFLSVVAPAEAIPTRTTLNPTCVINSPTMDENGCLVLHQTCCEYDGNMFCWSVDQTDCGPPIGNIIKPPFNN